jgi:hypothetical protein
MVEMNCLSGAGLEPSTLRGARFDSMNKVESGALGGGCVVQGQVRRSARGRWCVRFSLALLEFGHGAAAEQGVLQELGGRVGVKLGVGLGLGHDATDDAHHAAGLGQGPGHKGGAGCKRRPGRGHPHQGLGHGELARLAQRHHTLVFGRARREDKISSISGEDRPRLLEDLGVLLYKARRGDRRGEMWVGVRAELSHRLQALDEFEQAEEVRMVYLDICPCDKECPDPKPQ